MLLRKDSGIVHESTSSMWLCTPSPGTQTFYHLLHLLFKDSFSGYSILGWQLLSFSSWKTSFRYLLAAPTHRSQVSTAGRITPKPHDVQRPRHEPKRSLLSGQQLCYSLLTRRVQASQLLSPEQESEQGMASSHKATWQWACVQVKRKVWEVMQSPTQSSQLGGYVPLLISGLIFKFSFSTIFP